MGIVIRKSLATTIFSYLGVAIGYLNLLYFFPKFLSTSQIGLYRLVLDTALLLTPFAQAGITQGIIKFYPASKDPNEKKDLELFSFLFLFFSLCIFSTILILLKEDLLSLLFSQNKDQIEEFYNLLLFLIIILSLFAFFEGFSRANTSIVLVNFLKDVFIRILTTVSIFLFFKKILSFEGLVYSLLVIYGIATLILSFQTTSKYKLSLRFNLKTLSFYRIREMVKYNFFMVISAGSNLVVGKIDSLMISALLGLAENGIYQIMFFVAVVVEIPKRAVSQVAISLYSKAFAKNNLQEIKILYFKTALNQLIVGLLLYIGIVINLHNLFFFIPNGEAYEVGKWVVVIIGASRVLDMAAGSNGELIVMSKFYHFNVIAITSLAFLTVLTNYFFIPSFGINGAAIASFISLALFNLVKMVFIYKKFKLQPFNSQSLKVLAIGTLTFTVGILLPAFGNHFLDLLIRSSLVAFFYGLLIYGTKASEDINNFLNNTFKSYFRSNKNHE